jgi:hypothetical protein
MPDMTMGLISAGSQLLGGLLQADAASDAADAQSASAQAGIAEQRRQFDAIRGLLKPYTDAGVGAIGGLQSYAQAGAPALQQQMALAGLAGSSAQQAAMGGIEQSPMFQALLQQGETGILQNASATGGLRGGNTQGALAQFRPALLAQEIERQYSRLGGLATMGQSSTQRLAEIGQASAAGVGTSAGTLGANVSNLLGQQGAAQAGGILGQAAGTAGIFNAIPQGLGMYYGITGQSPFGGTTAVAPSVGAGGFGAGANYGLSGGGSLGLQPPTGF